MSIIMDVRLRRDRSLSPFLFSLSLPFSPPLFLLSSLSPLSPSTSPSLQATSPAPRASPTNIVAHVTMRQAQSAAEEAPVCRWRQRDQEDWVARNEESVAHRRWSFHWSPCASQPVLQHGLPADHPASGRPCCPCCPSSATSQTRGQRRNATTTAMQPQAHVSLSTCSTSRMFPPHSTEHSHWAAGLDGRAPGDARCLASAGPCHSH